MAIAALIAAPQQARAQLSPTQSFQGTGTVVAGGASIAQSGTVDTVRVSTPEAVINWRPNDTTGTGSINFLPGGRRVQFLGDADFTVFNRIIPVNAAGAPVSRMIELNGQIDSFVLGQQGGNVWFYSPGGILVGGTGVINVGSLVLSTRDIDTTGGLFGPGGTIRFGGSAVATPGTITLANGAQINADVSALPGSSYVALVAPRIEQGGTIRANGAVALVAAEAVDIRVNVGLFDIFVTTGSDDTHGIIHTGSTGGPSDTSVDFESRAYLVAIPKTQAMTMLLSGTIGFQTTLTAGIDANGGIVLSAGNNVAGGADAGDAGATGRASMSITDTLFWNGVNGVATNEIVGRPNLHCAPNCLDTSNLGQIGFYRGGNLTATNRVDLSVGQAQRIFAIGDLQILAATPGIGGIANLTVDDAAPAVGFNGDGAVEVTGLLLLDASAGASEFVNDGASTGGTATLSATQGRIRAGQIDVRASAVAAASLSGVGQLGQGGTARALANTDGTIESTFGSINVQADGRGGQDLDGLPIGVGGNGVGGSATVNVTGGSLIAAQGLGLSARGTGGVGQLVSGNGTGGTARIDVTGPDSILTSGFVAISAGARGGGSSFLGTAGFVGSADAGDATGGTATLAITDNNGLADIGFLIIDTDARGGDSTQPSATGVTAGNGTGGSTNVSLTRSTFTPSTVIAGASGSGGDATGALSDGGNGNGGTVSLDVVSSSLIADSGVRLLALGVGGVGPDRSGNGTGGRATASGFQAQISGPELTLDAAGLGGGAFNPSASFAPATTIGGNGNGGIVQLLPAVTGQAFGTINVTDINLLAGAIGGDPRLPTTSTATPQGGSATGGQALMNVDGINVTADRLTFDVTALAGSSGTVSGTTGNATAGSAGGVVRPNAGSTFSIADTLTVLATANARTGGSGRIGNLTGGQASLQFTRTTLDVRGAGGILLDASAGTQTIGGPVPGVGTLTGGSASLLLNLSQATANSLVLSGRAVGPANGGTTASGAVRGGSSTLTIAAGSSFDIANDLVLDASAVGGNAFEGAAATGGTASILVGANAVTTPDSLTAATTTLDVDGRSGGRFGAASLAAARGGTVNVSVGAAAGALASLGQLTVNASGLNISTATLPDGYTGPIGGNATGGSMQLTVAPNGQLELDDSQIFLEGRASAGGTGQGGSFLVEVQNGGALDLNQTSVSLFGSGGMGIGTRNGGLGRGGSATLLLTGGTVDIASIDIAAEGVGGHGADGFIAAAAEQRPTSGGSGQGGTIGLVVSGATFNAGTVRLNADARGGDGGDFDPTTQSDYYVPGSGGLGTGGEVSVALTSGGATADVFELLARGRGGDGGRITGTGAGNLVLRGPSAPAPAGGLGNGGVATFRMAGATFNFAPRIDAGALGGAGGTALAGATGGDALGGTAEAIIDNVDAGVVDVALLSNATGGAGGNGLHGAGGSGGTAAGGRVAVTTTGANARATVNSTLVQALGTGGTGGNGAVSSAFTAVTNGFDGGQGGEGRGGEAALTSAGGEMLVDAANGFLVAGLGGNGGNGANNPGSGSVATFGGNGGAGGGGFGGTISLTGDGGSVASATAGTVTLSAGANAGAGGNGGTGTVIGTFNPATGQTSFAGGNGFAGAQGLSTGGTGRIVATASAGSRVAFDGLDILVDGDSGGRVELIDDTDGAGLDLGLVTVQGNGAANVTGDFTLSGTGVYLRSALGLMSLGGLDITTGGDVRFDAIGTGGFDVTGNVRITAGNELSVNHTDRPGNAKTINASAFEATAGRITLGNGTRVYGSNLLFLSSVTDIAFDELASDGGAIEAFANGFIAGNSAVAIPTAIGNGSITMDGNFGVNVGTLDAGGPILVRSSGIAAVGNLISRLGAASVEGNGVIVDAGSTGTTFTVRGGTGDALIGTFTSGATSDIAANRDIRIASLTTTGGIGSNAIVNAGRDVLLGAINSAGNLSITARNLALSGTTPSSLIAAGTISVGSTGTVNFGSANGQSLMVSAPGAVTFGSTATGGATTINGASISGGSVTTTNGNVLLNGPGGVNLSSASIGGILTLTANAGSVTLGTAVASADIRLNARDAINVTSARTSDTGPGSTGNPADIIVTTGGAVSAGTLNAAENLFINAGSLTGATSTLAAGSQIGITTSGSATFGTADAQGLAVNAGGGVTFNRAETAGTLSMTAAGDIRGNQATSRTANVSLRSNNGGILVTNIAAGLDAVLDASGTIDVQSARTTSGDLVAEGGVISIGSANVGGRASLTSAAGATLGGVTAVGDIIVTAGGSITTADLVSTAGGTINLAATGDIALTSILTTGNVGIDGRSISAAATGLIRAANLTALARTGGLALGNVEAAAIDLDAPGGAIDFREMTATGVVTVDGRQITGASLASPGSIRLNGLDGVDMGLVHGGSAVTLAAANGTVSVANLRGQAIDARGRALDLRTTANSIFTVARATAGDIFIRGDGGTVTVNDGEASGDIDIFTNNALTAGRLIATNIDLGSNQTVTLNGNQTASAALDIDATRAVTVNGIALGATINVTSGDITIGSSGRIGQVGTTTQLTMTNGNPTVRTFVGGNDTTAGYSLSAAEMLRLFANNVTIVAPQVVVNSATAAAPTALIGLTRQPDLTIDTFTFNGAGGTGGNLGTNGTLRIETPGFARVIGAAQLANAGSGNRLTLVGQQSLEVILGQGSVRVTNGGALAGTLELVSQDVVVATAAAITDIAAAAGDLSAIEDRLAVNDGVASDEGAISADAIRINASGVYIQNTGTGSRFGERRGYTAGSGGVTVTFPQPSSTGSPVNGVLVINGRTSDGAGGFLTGLDAFPTVIVGDVALEKTNQIVNGLIAGSTLNGCDILGAGACREFIFTFPEPDNPLFDEEDEESEQTSGESDPPGVLVDIRDVDPLPNEPLVDDPVTGAGNDDLWAPLPE